MGNWQRFDTVTIGSDPDCIPVPGPIMGWQVACAALSPTGSVLAIAVGGPSPTVTDLGGTYTYAPAIARDGGTLHFWAVTDAGTLRTYNTGSPGLTSLPGVYTSAPDCTTDGPNDFDCFTRGGDGGLWHIYKPALSGWTYESWGGQTPGWSRRRR